MRQFQGEDIERRKITFTKGKCLSWIEQLFGYQALDLHLDRVTV